MIPSQNNISLCLLRRDSIAIKGAFVYLNSYRVRLISYCMFLPRLPKSDFYARKCFSHGIFPRIQIPDHILLLSPALFFND